MGIQEQFISTGVAQVLVSFKAIPVGGGAALSSAASAIKLISDHSRLAETSRVEQVAATSKKLAAEKTSYHVYDNLGLALATVDSDGYEALRAHPEVEQVDAAPEIGLIRPAGPMYYAAPKAGLTWGLKRLGIQALWKQGLTGKGIFIGHLDTGVEDSHPMLKGAVDEFAEFDDLGNEVKKPKRRDSGHHGTHTAVTIAGRPVGSTSLGVAPGAKLFSAMVIEGGNVIARVLGGLNWAVGQGVRIVNLSLGFPGYRPEFQPIIQALRVRGVLPVVAIGNEGPGTSRSPGNYDSVVGVGAVDRRLRVAKFSSSQRFTAGAPGVRPMVPSLVAPGDEVFSALPSALGSYGFLSGTSMAAPHVSGLAALLLQANPHATIVDVEKALLESCKLAPRMTPERGGRGVPVAKRALQLITAN